MEFLLLCSAIYLSGKCSDDERSRPRILSANNVFMEGTVIYKQEKKQAKEKRNKNNSFQ